MECHIIHVEVAMVIRFPNPGQVVIRGAAGRDDRVDQPSLDQATEDAANSRRHQGRGEGQERHAGPIPEHCAKDFHADGDLLRGESTAVAHRLNEGGEVRGPGQIDVLHLAAEQIALPHPRGILGTR